MAGHPYGDTGDPDTDAGDVAIMTIPHWRCETCRLWREQAPHSTIGVCSAYGWRVVLAPDTRVVTAYDFGCIQWEKKPDGSNVKRATSRDPRIEDPTREEPGPQAVRQFVALRW
jgi:hypothetical protein